MNTASNTLNTNNIRAIFFKYWPCILLLLAFIGFISKSLYNYPIGLMAILGLYQIIKSPKILLHDQTLKLFTIVFLCFWLPLLASFPDAVNPERSLRTILPYLRFFFAGIFIIQEITRNEDRLKFVITGLFFLVFFWSIDATIQFAFGKNLLGFPYESGHITGMFYPRNTISHICSILSSFCFLYIYLNTQNKKWLLISLIPLFFIILLSGRRAAWVMLFLSSALFIAYWFIYAKDKIRFLKNTSIISIVILGILSTTIIFHEPTNNRFKVTMGLFSNDYETINKATAVRLPIWETAYTIFKSNPINGIGPRGFRYVYKDYANEGDYFVSVNDIPTQPHILILEILAETGLIGLLAYLIALFFIIRFFRHCNANEKLFPFLIPVLVALFPLNTHMALYGSIWSSMIWLLIALYFSKAQLILNKEKT